MDKEIKVSGLAQNAKGGAVVVTDNSEVYYIDGMSDWSDELLDKRVRVKGNLVTKEHKAEDLINEKGEYSQGMVGTQLIIMDAIIQKAP